MGKLIRFLSKRKRGKQKSEQESEEKEEVPLADKKDIDSTTVPDPNIIAAAGTEQKMTSKNDIDSVDKKSITTIRVSALGHKLTISLPSESNLSDLQSQIQSETGLPPPYQRLISRGKTIYPTVAMQKKGTNADGSIEHELLQADQEEDITPPTPSSFADNYNSTTTLQKAGFKPGSTSKAILMHTQNYTEDKESIDIIKAIDRELEENVRSKCLSLIQARSLTSDENSSTTAIDTTPIPTKDMISDRVARELITNLCCKLDAVETHGSTDLRSFRKSVFRKADEFDRILTSTEDQEGKEDEGETEAEGGEVET